MTETENKERKLDMFEVLKKIDSGDRTFLDNLDPATKKEFVPLLTMRWASSAGGRQAVLLNELVNTVVFKYYDHPELLYKLMVASSDRKQKRYTWIKPKPKDKGTRLAARTIAKYYNCPYKDAAIYADRLSLEDVLEMAEDLGYDNDLIKDLKAEYK